MKRLSILLIAAMAFAVAACSGDPGASATPQTSSAPATVVATPSPEPSLVASQAPSAPGVPASAGAGDSELATLLPDELNGMPRTEVPGLEALLEPALTAQGIDASNVDFVFASYGEGPDALAVQAIRVPSLGQEQLQLLSQMMAGAGSGVEVETEDIGGKSVLHMTGADVPAATYMYFAEGALFTVVGQSEDLAAQLLAELP